MAHHIDPYDTRMDEKKKSIKIKKINLLNFSGLSNGTETKQATVCVVGIDAGHL